MYRIISKSLCSVLYIAYVAILVTDFSSSYFYAHKVLLWPSYTIIRDSSNNMMRR